MLHTFPFPVPQYSPASKSSQEQFFRKSCRLRDRCAIYLLALQPYTSMATTFSRLVLFLEPASKIQKQVQMDSLHYKNLHAAPPTYRFSTIPDGNHTIAIHFPSFFTFCHFLLIHGLAPSLGSKSATKCSQNNHGQVTSAACRSHNSKQITFAWRTKKMMHHTLGLCDAMW